jgi:hypothetical protein
MLDGDEVNDQHGEQDDAHCDAYSDGDGLSRWAFAFVEQRHLTWLP